MKQPAAAAAAAEARLDQHCGTALHPVESLLGLLLTAIAVFNCQPDGRAFLVDDDDHENENDDFFIFVDETKTDTEMNTRTKRNENQQYFSPDENI